MANEWFYAKDGQKFGPVSGKRLKELATIGVLRRNDLIWSPGYSVWRPAKKFRGLLPKMDATSLNPAMSLFWKPGDAGGDDSRLQGMFLEPDSPATAITPPLPSGGAAKKPVAAAHTNGGAAPSAVRTAPKRPSVAATIAEPPSNPTSAPTMARPAVSQAAAPKRQPEAQPVVVQRPRGGWGGLSSKEKLLIGGGLAAMLLVYIALMFRALL